MAGEPTKFLFKVERDCSSFIRTIKIQSGTPSENSQVKTFSGEYLSGSNYTLFAFCWQFGNCEQVVYIDTLDEVEEILEWSADWFGYFEGNKRNLKEFLIEEELNYFGNFYVVIDSTGNVVKIQSVRGDD
jgi:hypothetical protein